jgi:hypothetical protein
MERSIFCWIGVLMRIPTLLLGMTLLGGCAEGQGEKAVRNYLGHLVDAIDTASALRDLLSGVDPAETGIVPIQQAVVTQSRLLPAGCASFTTGVISDKTETPAKSIQSLLVEFSHCSDGAGIVGSFPDAADKMVFKPSGGQMEIDWYSPETVDVSNAAYRNNVLIPGSAIFQQLPSGERQITFPRTNYSSHAIQTVERWLPANDCLTLDQDIPVVIYDFSGPSEEYRLLADNLVVCPSTCVSEGQSLRIEFKNYNANTSEPEIMTGKVYFGAGNQIDWELESESGSFMMNVCEL